MASYILRRILMMVPTLVIIGVVSFLIIQLPPGDFLSSYIARLEEQGTKVDISVIEALRNRYGLGDPVHVQFLKWAGGVLRGDFGQSFEWNKPVSSLIWERMLLTVIVSMASLLLTYVLAIPAGIYSATHQYSPGDYVITTIGFLGLATPSFLLALVMMFVFYSYLGMSVGGLFSPEFVEAPWSLSKVLDLANHLWIPMVVIGTGGTCSLIRVMRSCLLDELRKQYVVTARAKGVDERALLFRYPVRVAVNPIVSTLGWMLPHIVSGSTITAIVLNLPTNGPMMLQALLSQDMYLAGSFVLLLAALTVVGTLVSDILLVIVDPRIRYEANG